jgi:hypothetical protein
VTGHEYGKVRDGRDEMEPAVTNVVLSNPFFPIPFLPFPLFATSSPHAPEGLSRDRLKPYRSTSRQWG